MTGALILLISLPLSTIVLPFVYKAGFPVVDGLIQRLSSEKDAARLPAGSPPVARLRVDAEVVDGEPALRAALGLRA